MYYSFDINCIGWGLYKSTRGIAYVRVGLSCCKRYRGSEDTAVSFYTVDLSGCIDMDLWVCVFV